MARRDYTNDRPRREYGDRPRRSGGKEYTPAGYSKQEMNPEVYAKRRKVIDAIYDANKVVQRALGIKLPRFQARIVDKDPQSVIRKDAVGTASMGGKEIWIPEETVNGRYEKYLREIVFHEILHAAYAIQHDESSPLMSSRLTDTPMNDSDIDKWFIKHIKDVTKAK